MIALRAATATGFVGIALLWPPAAEVVAVPYAAALVVVAAVDRAKR
jgi:hypothetical protein